MSQDVIARLRERKRLANGPCLPSVLEHHDAVESAMKGLGIVEVMFPSGVTEMCRKSDVLSLLAKIKPRVIE